MNGHTRGLSKNKIKFIHSLSLKKHRDEHDCFVAEGSKLVYDLYQEVPPVMIIATQAWAYEQDLQLHRGELIIVEPQEMKQITTLKTPPAVIGVFPKCSTHFNVSQLDNQHLLLLDGIQDPGNLGTIIRTANWFGIKHLICSEDTVDVYNSKVVQASMGALIHVGICVDSLSLCIPLLQQMGTSVYGAFMEGENLYNMNLQGPTAFVLGNEGKGISPSLRTLLSGEVTIPHAPNTLVPESLNVASAAAVFCSELFRVQ